ncbi:hypothetical protein [Chryseolinea soli]|uniref:Uncharacterized protein n=1 Tax=Chryseolinea soli TaxID=2321403 RepID=A0A385SG28_9BACT|nr:hypothetical protein [Chryseolinea soli]AYB29842.1 hypothetical protein D4L85_04280 [Chryseolinea soli]
MEKKTQTFGPGKKQAAVRAPRKREPKAPSKEPVTETENDPDEPHLNQEEQRKVVNHLEENAQGSAKDRDEAT